MRISEKDKLDFICLLQTGKGVAEAAELLQFSYSSGCKILRDLSLNEKGFFKDKKLKVTSQLKSFFNYIVLQYKNIDAIALLFEVSRERISSILKLCEIKYKWKLEQNHNELLAASRRAELFCKNLGIKVVRDCYNCRDAGFKYDLILEGYGSVDCKSTIIRQKAGKPYASFNVQNFSKGVKYAFLVVMNTQRDDFLFVFAVPGKIVYGHSTISITLYPISNKYKQHLVWQA